MAYGESGSQLTGRHDIYVAPYGSIIPSVNVTPTSPWAKLGTTNGRQEIYHPGELKIYRINESLGPSKVVHGIIDVILEFTLPKLDPTDYARVLSNIDNVQVVSGVMELPLKREQFQSEYSLIMRGEILSKYGAFPGMYAIPRGVFDGEPRVLQEQDGTESMRVIFRALEDYEQEDENKSLGWMALKIS